MFLRRTSATMAFAFLLAASASTRAQFSGYYLEISGGPSQSEVDYLPSPSPGAVASTLDADSNKITLAVGTRFNDNISVEVGLSDLGTFSGPARLTDTLSYLDPADPENRLRSDAVLETDDGEYEVLAFSANLIGSWPLSRRLTVFGRLGLVAWEVESEFAGTMTEMGDVQRIRNVSAEFSDSGSSFQYGLGLAYRFNLNYGIKLEYQTFHFNSDIFSSRGEVNSLNLGFRLYL